MSNLHPVFAAITASFLAGTQAQQEARMVRSIAPVRHNPDCLDCKGTGVISWREEGSRITTECLCDCRAPCPKSEDGRHEDGLMDDLAPGDFYMGQMVVCVCCGREDAGWEAVRRVQDKIDREAP